MPEYGPGAVPLRDAGAIDHLRESVGYLHDRLDLLLNRLEPVLGADYPKELVPDPETRGSVLETHVCEVNRAASRVDNLISRLVL